MSKIDSVVTSITPVDPALLDRAQKRLDNLTKPRGSLGRLEEAARRVAAITGKEKPELKQKVIFTLAGDHGVAKKGVSAFPQDVTPQMVENFLRGGAGINVLARHVGARVVVVDMGVGVDIPPREGLLNRKVGYGTKDMSQGAAMTREEAIKAIETGIDIVGKEVKKGVDIVGTGDMGIANTTPSSAICSVMTGADVKEVTGRGTGIDDISLKHKIDVIKKAIDINKPDKNDPIDVLAKVGGFEIGGIAGIILACASRRIPVVIDGFISGAGALIACGLAPQAADYIFSSHESVEVGHKKMLEKIGVKAYLDLNLRLGEGTGAALAMDIIEAGVKIHNEMSTFGEAGVSEEK
ncbi:MAG: nicotinate-nucleotide--dimethylbenzimidazole phosphoribosyltransferase [Candidatus Omnitrophica bacterium]|nr:nicotinate-nucleotide--dimethylbenzimidazole phosphoribosyltransferase [Candidatus Omnitrophota bacterium]